MTRFERLLLAGAIFFGCFALGNLLAGCYAHTGPAPSCAEFPDTPGCLGGLHDQRARDGGAR
jgi:hypothetical protein